MILGRYRRNDQLGVVVFFRFLYMNFSGYRTLCIAYRDITEDEYLKWEPKVEIIEGINKTIEYFRGVLNK